jgi:predicted TIM-barrel fold metal-dependent hydrolase
MRRIDLHCYPGTPAWVDSQGPFAEALADYWKKPWVGRAEDEVVSDIRAHGLEAVLVAFDIESLTGAKPFSNQEAAAMRARHPDVFLGVWGAVDPLKGDGAIVEAERAAKEDRVLGFHFHPIMGRFRVDDPQYLCLFEAIRDLGLPVMVDVGTTGMGAGLPGALGARIDDAHPMAIDHLAATLPDLTIIAAHPGWPWVEEMTAVALHKGNVFWEMSGWAPKHFSSQLKVDIRARLQDKVMFGTDHPSLPFDRILREWDELGYSEDIMNKVFHLNAERVLGL